MLFFEIETVLDTLADMGLDAEINGSGNNQKYLRIESNTDSLELILDGDVAKSGRFDIAAIEYATVYNNIFEPWKSHNVIDGFMDVEDEPSLYRLIGSLLGNRYRENGSLVFPVEFSTTARDW